jgi:hypothetical protein
VCVGLPVGEAGEAVEAVAAHAAAGLRIGLVHVDADREVERMEAGPLEVVVQLLDARLVRDRGVRERAGARRLRRVLARLTLHEVEALGLCVVRLEVLVRDRPRRGRAAVVVDLLEVALAQTEEDGPVDLRVTADEVLRVWAEALAVLVDPTLLRDVAIVAEDLLRIPVLGLARQVAAALEEEDALAGRGQPVGERAAAGAGSDDDHVVVLGHVESSLLRRGRSGMSRRRWHRATSRG